ncbi:pilus assembly protein [Superficieibacter electus]|uniref:pilus assembly protein n=1 Tax=Superficieibacter electus TaxID=2022662 RepID=UPI00159EDC48|nr:pilus assembly protein [Superficieibacter electus]
MAFRLWQTGLHIQQDQVVIVALEHVRSRWSLRRWWQIPLVSGIVSQGQILQPEALADALRNWRRELPIQHCVRISLPADRTLQKRLSRPALVLRESEQAEWITHSMAQSLDMEPEVLCFDYLEHEQDNLYCVTAARQHDIASLSRLAAMLRLRLTAITPDACVLQHFLPWLKAGEQCLAWQHDERWLWATRDAWGCCNVCEVPSPVQLARHLACETHQVVQCTSQTLTTPQLDPWSTVSLQHPPLPACGDRFTIALGLALGEQ